MTDQRVKLAGEYADADQLDEALTLCNQILYDEPDNFKALFVAGSVLMKAGKHVQAIQLLKRVCELRPADHRGWGQVALCYGEFHKYDESIRYAEKALSLKRESKTLSDCAYAYVNAGEWEKGSKAALDALKLDPENKDSQLHITNYALATRDWRNGWIGFRLTQRTKFRKEWEYGNTKEWQGESDAVVMVTGEQGLGDEIMAATVIPDAAKRCKRFIFDCDERLAPLFQRSFPNVIVTGTRRSKTVKLPVLPTHHKTLFGLCEIFRNVDEEFPRVATLTPNPDYVRMFKAMFSGPVIGIAWSGGLPRTGLEVRKVGLNAMLPLVRRGGTFVSLEYRDDAEEVEAFAAQHGMKVVRLPWVTQGKDMDLLAGLLAACDEVIGIHTSALHMAAALGVPTTFITHRGSGWRYAGDDLPWYPPSTKLHRKRLGESWRDCVARLAEGRK
jgi:hypothetical protein